MEGKQPNTKLTQKPLIMDDKIIFALSGIKQSGKDTVGNFIQNSASTTSGHYNRIQFASPLKKVVAALLDKQVEDLEKEEVKNELLPPYFFTEGSPFKEGDTVRTMLTTYGDLFRSQWPNMFAIIATNQTYSGDGSWYSFYRATDTRYANEVQALVDTGAKVVRILITKFPKPRYEYVNDSLIVDGIGHKFVLGGDTHVYSATIYTKHQAELNFVKALSLNWMGENSHSSETEMFSDKMDYDHIIYNSGTLQDLEVEVYKLLRKYYKESELMFKPQKLREMEAEEKILNGPELNTSHSPVEVPPITTEINEVVPEAVTEIEEDRVPPYSE